MVYIFLKLSEYNESYTYIFSSPNNKPKKILCIETGRIFKSISECAEIMRLHKNGISKVCSGNLKTTGGYTFKYIDK